MRGALAGLLAGLLFGGGLALSGMTDPAIVLGFLDVAGQWNPTLAFVMAAALSVTFVGYRLAWRQRAPIWAPTFELPTTHTVDGRLLVGAALFGIGWGIAGWCPGPAIASLSAPSPELLLFLAAMILGILIARIAGSPAQPDKDGNHG